MFLDKNLYCDLIIKLDMGNLFNIILQNIA